MSSQQPPNKRRKLSNNRAEDIHTPHSNSNSHEIEGSSDININDININNTNNGRLPGISTSNEIAKAIKAAQCGVDGFYQNWQYFIEHHIDEQVPIRADLPDTIYSNIGITPEILNNLQQNNHNNNENINNISESSSSSSSSLMTLESDYKNDIQNISKSQAFHNNNNNHNNHNNHNNDNNDDNKNDELIKQIDELKQNNIKLMDDLNKQKKQMRKYKNLHETALKQKEFYHLRLKALAQMIKQGASPRFDGVKMNKTDSRMSDNIKMIKDKIRKFHLNTHSKSKQNYVTINHYENHKWIKKKTLSQIINNHISYPNNGINATKPDILIRKKPSKKHKHCTRNKHSRNKEESVESISYNIDDYAAIPYNCILKTFRIKEHRIKALRTGYQRGLKVLSDIPKATVIGQYVGYEYQDDEYRNIFGHSNEEAVRNVYAFDQTLNVPIDPMNKNTKFRQQKMIIDGYGLREIVNDHQRNNKECEYSAHLLYINDCREDISNQYPTEEDEKYRNIDFVNAEVNGFGMVFVVTRCDIKKDTELLSWYGAEYDLALQQQSEYQRMRNCIIGLVDNSVLRGVDLTNDVWTID